MIPRELWKDEYLSRLITRCNGRQAVVLRHELLFTTYVFTANAYNYHVAVITYLLSCSLGRQTSEYLGLS